MKIKPTNRRGGVLVELGQNEAQLPSETLFQLKRILVPVDFSDCSRKALAYAVPFAKQFGAEIVLAYVVRPYIPVAEMSSYHATEVLSQMRESGRCELERLRLGIPDDVKIKTVLRVGNPAPEIVEAAAELNVDLILLSTHGRTGWGRVFLGSVAEDVTRHARCPVLTVRECEHEFIEIPSKATGTKSVRKNADARERLYE